ncbi:MAG: hypothetical protein NTY68_03845 [Candidatus Micrarchaeota archaeon]|nr:hypothetical protein [Candidatus Micrarchaeota archaeon]
MRREILALLLLVSFASAQTLNISAGTEKLESGTLSKSISSLFSESGKSYNWVKVSLILIVISLIANAMIYFVAKIFQMAYLESGFKLEMREAFFNVMIIVFFGALSIFLDNALSAPLMCGQPSNCIVDTSISYVDKLIDSSTTEMISIEKKIITDTKKTATTGGSAGWAGIDVGYSYDFSFINRIDMIEPGEKVNLYQQAVMNLVVIKVFLTFFAYYLGPMLIIFGIMLKALFITRRLGSTMIALGVAASIILPLTIISILIANGEIKIPGVQYMTNKDCPEECLKEISGFNSTSSLDSAYIIATAGNDPKVTFGQVKNLTNGSSESLKIDGLGTVYSCEFYNIKNAIAINASYLANPTLALRMSNPNYTVTVDCPQLCRTLPYPADMAECRDGERACAALLSQAPNCFKKNYGFENFNYTFAFNGEPMNLSKALAQSSCFRVTPLSIVDKTNPLVFCPTKCRFFYSDGTAPCMNFSNPSSPTYDRSDYNCTDIYKSAAKENDVSKIKSKIAGIYSSINTSLSATSPNTASIVASSKSIAIPIYETDNPGCLNLMNLPESMKYAPNYLDCSACQDQAGNKAGAKTQEGKMLAYSIILGIFSIAITLAAAVAISMGIEGEMFIPGLNRLK